MKELETVVRITGKILYLGSTLPAAVSMYNTKKNLIRFREVVDAKILTFEEAERQVTPCLMHDAFILGYAMAVAYAGYRMMNWKDK